MVLSWHRQLPADRYDVAHWGRFMTLFEMIRFVMIPMFLLGVIASAFDDLSRGSVRFPGLYLAAVLFAIAYVWVRSWMKEEAKAMSRTEPDESERAIVRAEELQQARGKNPAAWLLK